MKLGLALLVTVVLFTVCAKAEEFNCYSDCYYYQCSPASATPGFAILAIENVRVFCYNKKVIMVIMYV